MSSSPQRKIEYALIEGVGPISAKHLVALPEIEWGLLRQAITDAWRGGKRRQIARCLMCSGGVFIRAKAFRGLRLPMFAHFKGADGNCPWFTGETAAPNALRAGQYHGRQESVAHRLLCEQIASLVGVDPACASVEVARYLPPTENAYGRYPDVLAVFSDGRRIAFEVQLSNTFQTEISDRCLHYEREGVSLIWVLLGAEVQSGDLPQSFRDVILRHRGNAFALDRHAVEVSQERGKLFLTCFLSDDTGGFDSGRLVGVDDLTYPNSGCPYFEDRVTPSLLARGKAIRSPWWAAMGSINGTFTYNDFENDQFVAANDDLCARVPQLRYWQEANFQGRWAFANFVTVLFSALSEAAGRFRNYSSRQDNVVALLNSKIPSEAMLPFAQVMHSILHRTSLSSLLDGTVGTHLHRALDIGEGNFLLETDGAWSAAQLLLPEVFDPSLRLQLATLGELPSWAQSDRAHLAFEFA
ncbi:MAG: DUF6035 family protein [Caulobacter sp.]|nr:DUF6035 family protein [Caulobacter sp.]